ncbi:MAG: hypothetical protein HY268_09980 [Deltaproteobacteria bacterium]|nr:hypothetical protein [Deltaproteobacteria bacterium]
MPRAQARCFSFLWIFFAVGGLAIGRNADAQGGTVSLIEVLKEPTKFVGQRACWVGHNMGYSTVRGADGRVEERTSTWMALDDKKSVVPEQTFVADEIQAKRTDVATKADNTSGDRGDRLACGTLKGSKDVSIDVGSEKRKIQAPLLADVTFDTVPAQK